MIMQCSCHLPEYVLQLYFFRQSVASGSSLHWCWIHILWATPSCKDLHNFNVRTFWFTCIHLDHHLHLNPTQNMWIEVDININAVRQTLMVKQTYATNKKHLGRASTERRAYSVLRTYAGSVPPSSFRSRTRESTRPACGCAPRDSSRPIQEYMLET